MMRAPAPLAGERAATVNEIQHSQSTRPAPVSQHLLDDFGRRVCGDEILLLCPRCGYECLHHDSVAVYQRAEDSPAVLATVISGRVVNSAVVPNRGSGNPSSRRDGICIGFWCEGCGDGLILNLAQHKGGTFLSWTIQPASEVWR